MISRKKIHFHLGILFSSDLIIHNIILLSDQLQNAYSAGTKKQKMAISKSIVERIYSMDPPGRFLKKCPNTGGWEELSLKEAATRTSQAMAYAVRESAKQKKEVRSLRSKSNKGAASSQSAKKPPRLPSYVNVQHNASAISSSTARASAAARSGRGGEVGTDADSSVSNEDDGNKVGGNNEISQSTLPAANPSLQQQLLQLQQQSSTASLQANSGTPLNGLVQLLAQAQLQQRQQQNQQLLRQLLGQFPLGLQTQLPSTSSLPSTLPMSTPSLSGPLLPNGNSDIFRQASALPQGSSLINLLQQSSLLQNQAQTQSSPLSTQSLLGLMSMLQNQPQPTPTITPQFPWLSQQLNQVQQNQLNQVQQNQLLTSLLTTSPNQTLLQQQQSQPLNLLQQATLLQQQMAQNSSNYHSNSNPMTGANAAAAAKEKGGGEKEDNSDKE